MAKPKLSADRSIERYAMVNIFETCSNGSGSTKQAIQVAAIFILNKKHNNYKSKHSIL